MFSFNNISQNTIKLDEDLNLNEYTVLLPSVCVGNAAQLAVDLIISTLEMRKVATVWHVSSFKYHIVIKLSLVRS